MGPLLDITSDSVFSTLFSDPSADYVRDFIQAVLKPYGVDLITLTRYASSYTQGFVESRRDICFLVNDDLIVILEMQSSDLGKGDMLFNRMLFYAAQSFVNGGNGPPTAKARYDGLKKVLLVLIGPQFKYLHDRLGASRRPVNHAEVLFFSDDVGESSFSDSDEKSEVYYDKNANFNKVALENRSNTAKKSPEKRSPKKSKLNDYSFNFLRPPFVEKTFKVSPVSSNRSGSIFFTIIEYERVSHQIPRKNALEDYAFFFKHPCWHHQVLLMLKEPLKTLATILTPSSHSNDVLKEIALRQTDDKDKYNLVLEGQYLALKKAGLDFDAFKKVINDIHPEIPEWELRKVYMSLEDN